MEGFSAGDGLGKPGLLEEVSERTIVLVTGFGMVRAVWVFGPDEVSANTGGEDLLETEAERRVSMRAGVKGDISDLGTSFHPAVGGVLPVEGVGAACRLAQDGMISD